MTTDKARKRAVRTRMHKTGERYAAARRHVVNDGTVAFDTLPPLPSRIAEPGTSDVALIKATSHDWDHWLRLLDDWGAIDRPHRDIARFLADVHGVAGWWAQNVTVGYERARGRRAVHETTRGFEVSVSRTVDSSAPEVWTALTQPPGRYEWLDADRYLLVASRPGRWARFAIAAEPSTTTLYVDPVGDDRTRVTVTHARLADAEEVVRQRATWHELLDRFADTSRATTRVARSGDQAS